MYSGSSDGESHEAVQRKIPPASSMPWVRNLRRYIGSGAGLGSEALMGPCTLVPRHTNPHPPSLSYVLLGQICY